MEATNDGTAPVEIGLLGSLTLRVDGVEVAVPGIRRRALLALLALAGPRGVSAHRLVDALWGSDVPNDPVAALHNLVSRLRRHLGGHAGLLQRRPDGYRLTIDADAVDAVVVRDLVTAAASAVDAATRLSLTSAALELWRGPPLAEFDSVADLDADRISLTELRFRLDDLHLDALVTTGSPSATSAASASVAANPLRESAVRILMRALAAEGRTAEAMAVAADHRARLADEHGVDPSPALAALEERVAAGEASALESAAPRSSSRRLPRPATRGRPFVGRERERVEVARLLGEHRLVTVTGTGGVGKTSLALEIVADPAEFPDHAAYVVDLSAVTRADRVDQAVASTLGLQLGATVSASTIARGLAAVTDGISASRIIVVLDNCEHVVSECRALADEIIRTATDVRILATSRVILGSSAEYVVRLQPLQATSHVRDVESAVNQPAVRAFLAHTRRRLPEFVLDEHDVPDLVEVLVRVDGLPLGIELAARQAAVMPLHDVARTLDGALDLATGHGPGDWRHHTMRASVDLSFGLLARRDQVLLAALAPFAGGVDLRALMAVAERIGVDAPTEALHRLVESSLLVADATTGRYRLLYLVRLYLLDHLRASGALGPAQDRFIDVCAGTAREIATDWLGSGERQADRRLRAELDNLREARDVARSRGRIDVLVTITTSLDLVGTWRNIPEIWRWALELAAMPELEGSPGRVAVLSAAAEAARLMGTFDAALDHAQRAFELAGPHEPSERHLVCAHAAIAAVAHFRGDVASAVEQWSMCGALTSLGPAYLASAALATSYNGDTIQATRLLARARAGIDDAAGPSQHAFLDYVQAELVASDDPSTALALYRRAQTRAEDVGATFIVGVARVGAASCLAQVGDLRSAADAYVFLLEAWRASGQPTQLWTTARNAATLLRTQGHRDLAERLVACAAADPAAAAEHGSGDEGPHESRSTVGPLDGDLVLDRALSELRVIADAVSREDVLR